MHASLSSHFLFPTFYFQLPTEIGTLTKLDELALDENPYLIGNVPSELGMLSELRIFDIGSTGLAKSVPLEVCLLSTRVSFGHYCPREACNCTELCPCNLASLGYLPTSIGLLSNLLEDLDLERESLTGTVPSEVGLLTKLTSLNLNRNRLSGHLPSEVALLTALQFLDLGGNQFAGALKSELGMMTALQRLQVGSEETFYVVFANSFTGPLPFEMAMLTSLTSLEVQHNKLTGTIPNWVGTLSRLEWLQLNDNNFSGIVPTHTALLTDLRTLRIDGNPLLTGIPSELAMMSSLRSVSLRGTDIYENIPPSMCNSSSFRLSVTCSNSKHFYDNCNNYYCVRQPDEMIVERPT